ncbi:EboA domain-containing protein [Streptomyces sp. NPDC060194]|uniref:EboA domain-containing protein n=1 Tax=Streptomyces sp. NPDC060194 TaxID=3347069 RepID=UPI003646D9F0
MVKQRAEVEAALDEKAVSWLDAALTEASVGLPTWQLSFAAAGRATDPRLEDDVRVLILAEARPDPATLTTLYHQGTPAERRAVLTALPALVTTADAVPLVEDALRTNDTTLVAAAVGPYAAAHLDPHAWRHAVLKCLFTGVRLAAVADLDRRAAGDAELARMLSDFAAERTAAGRPVPDDLPHVLAVSGAPGSGTREETAS